MQKLYKMGGGFKELALENIKLIGNRATHHRAKRKEELHCDVGAFLTYHLSFCLFFFLFISYLTRFSLACSVVLRVAGLCLRIDRQTRHNHQHSASLRSIIHQSWRAVASVFLQAKQPRSHHRALFSISIFFVSIFISNSATQAQTSQNLPPNPYPNFLSDLNPGIATA